MSQTDAVSFDLPRVKGPIEFVVFTCNIQLQLHTILHIDSLLEIQPVLGDVNCLILLSITVLQGSCFDALKTGKGEVPGV